jgi:N-acetylmuramoyl-L-alanine amidase
MYRETRILRRMAPFFSSRAKLAPMVVASCLAAGCAAPPVPWQSSPLASMHVASPNANQRRPTLIVLHHTGEDSFVHALATLTDPRSEVSAHYLISRDGRVAQLVDERQRAWHAGVGRWGPISDVNSASIGIELDNDGKSPFSDPQITSLIALLHDLIGRYHIDARNVIGHADITPHRKDDPSVFFPWSRLAAEGIGLWCWQPDEVSVAPLFDDAAALRQIGYQVDSEDQFSAARLAFRRHFLASEQTGALNPRERAVLACIANQQASRAIS